MTGHVRRGKRSAVAHPRPCCASWVVGAISIENRFAVGPGDTGARQPTRLASSSRRTTISSSASLSRTSSAMFVCRNSNAPLFAAADWPDIANMRQVYSVALGAISVTIPNRVDDLHCNDLADRAGRLLERHEIPVVAVDDDELRRQRGENRLHLRIVRKLEIGVAVLATILDTACRGTAAPSGRCAVLWSRAARRACSRRQRRSETSRAPCRNSPSPAACGAVSTPKLYASAVPGRRASRRFGLDQRVERRI